MREIKVNIALCTAIILTVLAFTADNVNAATFTVANAANTGAGSLRQAVADANALPSADTIVFDQAFFSVQRTITLASVITINGANDTLTITGPGASLLTVSGNDLVQVFSTSSGEITTITEMTIAHAAGGAVTNAGTLTVNNVTFDSNTDTNGGAITNSSGVSLTVNNCTFINNTNTAPGVNGSGGAAIYTTDIATINNSTFINNRTTSGAGGGAIDTRGVTTITDSTFTGNFTNNTGQNSRLGGAINSQGGSKLTINRSVFSGNSSTKDGGAIYHQPNATSGPVLTITHTTFTNNTSNSDSDTTGTGGAIHAEGSGSGTITHSTFNGNTANTGSSTTGNGGALYNELPMTVSNSTFSGNNAGRSGGGIYNATDLLSIDHTTIVNNIAPISGGGLFRFGGTARIKDTILANNTSPSGPNISGTIDSFGYNLIEVTTGGTVTGITSTNITGQDPNVGPLADNGGFTRTHALLPGSPAIDRGQAFPATEDQRLQTRPVDNPDIANFRPDGTDQADGGSDGSDIGSFEVQPAMQFSAANYSVAENGGPFLVTVTRTGGTQGVDSVQYTLSPGTATAGATCTANVDYIAASGIVQFAEGQASQTFAIQLCDDASFETNETINLTLSTPVGGTLGSQTTSVLTINENDAAPSPTPTSSSTSISGVVTYGTAPAGAPKFVPGVLLTAVGSVPANATTNATGAYALTGLGAGAYAVTPSKTGDTNGISGLDAARVAQHVAGLIVLTPNQQTAGDATNNGSLSGLDAARIAQTAAGLPNPGIVGQWKFVPVSRSYPSVTGALAGENYEAILVGDVTGNWSPSLARPSATADDDAESDYAPALVDSAAVRREDVAAGEYSEAVELRLLPAIAAAPGAGLTIPISIGDTTGKGIVAYDFTIEFDPNALLPADAVIDTAGTLSDGWTIVHNAQMPGQLRVTAFSTGALGGDGVLLNLRFDLRKLLERGDDGGLKWTALELNEGKVNSRGASITGLNRRPR